MVNSSSFDAAGSEGESVKAEFTQLEDDAAEASFSAVVPESALLDVNPSKPTKSTLQCSVPLDKVKNVLELCNHKKLNNYFILENYLKTKNELTEMPETSKPAVKRLMCLFCDRTFTSNNLKQKHVDRCHSSGQTRRSSSRTPSHNQSTTACYFCSRLNHTEHTLKELLEHLINEHSNRYFACLPCQERFHSVQALRDHNQSVHGLIVEPKTSPPSPVTTSDLSNETATSLSASDVVRPELKRTTSNESSKSVPTSPKESSSPSNAKPVKRNSVRNVSSPETSDEQQKSEKQSGFHEDFEDAIHANVISQEEAKKLKPPETEPEDIALTRRSRNGAVNAKTKNAKKNQIVNKKISVKSTKNGLRNNLRTTRASVKQISTNFTTKRKNKINKTESVSTKENVNKKPGSNPASVFSLVNAYTYKYEKIYDHASDSIKDANSVQFNAVFDKEFYSRTVCNIRENLLHHLDGKLNRNIESESRISNFEHNVNLSETDSKPANDAVHNFGCDLSLNAVTPVATLLGSSQYGEDFDAQIEYGAKASQKKPKKVAVVKYKFPNKKYNSLFREKDTHNDLTNLDMWTQLSVKKRQHKYNDDCSFSEFFLHYQRPTGEAQHQVEELNRILDTRGPFEDLRMEANAAQFLELRKKSVKDGDSISEEASKDVYFVLDDLLNRVMCKISENSIPETDILEIKDEDLELKNEDVQNLELPSYLQLEKSQNSNEYKIDQTDCIALICSSQDEKDMKEKKYLELTGEWARPRIYICATCGLKLPNLKALEDHKNINHPQIWCSHYEFVGNQSDIYRHLSIPGLGKVGVVELLPVNRLWQRSDARVCSKCSKQCHNLGELHKHILECGGDWTWNLARKKCKYRPYGARTRRRRQRGYKRSCNPDVQRAREHKPKIKPIFIGPRPKPSKPSDAETIERMLANLPPKRNRKMISMRDGIQRPRKPYKQKLNNQNSVNSQTSPKPTKKVHFKNTPVQMTKQTIRNSLKRKINANKLRKQIKNDSETENSDTPLTRRGRIKKDNNGIETINESDVTLNLIGKRTKIRNKRMISRILGSKIFDSNSALKTRRKLVKAITQNNLIRKTRLRSKMNAQKSQVEKDESEDDLPLKNKATENDKKTKVNTKSIAENNSKLITNEDSNSKLSESDTKIKKSNTKRFLSVLTKSNKKSKTPNKPDTISAIIDEVISKATKNESVDDKVNAEEKSKGKKIRRTRSSSSLLKIDPSESKNNTLEENATSKESDSKPEKVINKKTNKLVQNVKSFRKSFRKSNNNKIEKTEGITSKLIRTLSMRGRKKKTVKKDETIGQKPTTTEVNDFKKTTTDISNPPKETTTDKQSDLETVVHQCDTIDSESKISDSEVMPTLEKIEPLPSNISSDTSANSIPILCPININSCYENNTCLEKNETKSDSELCEVSDNKTELKCDNTSANSCNNTLNKLKSKIKRSGRGLNDCIAMLKCKLEMKYPNTEPSLADKSNLFIINSTEVNKCSQPVVQENTEITPSISVDSTKDSPNTLTDNDTEKETSSNENLKNSEENKLPENENINEVVNEAKKPEVKNVNVLEIPLVKRNSKSDDSTSEMATVETQTQTIDEDIVPNAAIDYIPTNIQTNFQLSYVLNATLQNCLMECVKNKCEKFKIENQNLPLKSNQNRSGTKIGSVRKKRAIRKSQINTEIEKHIPNIPVLLNTAFIESTPKKSNKITNNTLDSTSNSSKAASDTSDDDIPLSKFVSNSSSCTKLKLKLPVAKKKRSSKKHIAFTPLILNKQDDIPQVSCLQENIEQHISLDNSMNNKIEAIQSEIASTKDNVIEKDDKSNDDVLIDTETNKDVIQESVIIENKPNDIENVIEDNTLVKEIENQKICENITIESSNINETTKLNNDEQSTKEDSNTNLNADDINTTNKVDELNKEVLQENSVNVVTNKSEEINNEIQIVKESVISKDVVDSIHPLSQQIMTMEDEPCDSFLINKTLTEVNIKPSTPTKSVFQTNSPVENVEFHEINHFDSGKENTECQKVQKQKRVIKKQKKKRGRKKVIHSEQEVNEPITDISNTDLDQTEKPVEDINTSNEEIPADDIHTSNEEMPEVIINNFKSQLQSSLDDETESTIMENKNIQEPPIILRIKPIEKLRKEQTISSSDSEDELPLALLINKSATEEDNLLESETNKSEQNVHENDCHSSTENIINDIFNEEQNIIVNTQINNECTNNIENDENSYNFDVNLTELNEIENNDEISFMNDEIEIEPETQINSNKSHDDKIIIKILKQSDIDDKADKPNKYLETHFDVENNMDTIENNFEDPLSCSENQQVSNIKGEHVFDLLNTPSTQNSDNKSSFITTPDIHDKSLVIKIKRNLKIKLRKSKKTRSRVIPKSLSKYNVRKKEREEDETHVVICDICNKTFKRKENLASHKRTLTHIAKLSEIEAREMALRISEQEENRDKNLTEPEIQEQGNEIMIESIENNIINNDKEIEPEPINDLEFYCTNVNSTLVENEMIEDKKEITIEETYIKAVDIETLKEIKQQPENIISDEQEIDTIENNDELLLPSMNIDKSPVNVLPVENDNIIEIDDESSLDSQPELIEFQNINETKTDEIINEPEIIKPIQEILEEPQIQNTNLLPSLMVHSNTANLKLVDIISEVLDKPVNNLHIRENYHPQNITRSAIHCDSNDKFSEPKRYKSLGERKSFDSDHFNIHQKSNDEISTKENYNTSISSINNGLLNKQLSLLENIIDETNPNLNYIDDSISLSSNQFDEPVEQNISEKDLFKPEYNKLNNPQIKFSHSADVLSSFIKPTNHFNNFENISESFVKPAKQYQEVSDPLRREEKSVKSIKENTKRKILNRDEELFLECCSLLKSGSEISAISKKSTRNIPLHNFSRSNDASWIIQKQPNSDQFIQRDSYSWLAQTSRVDTPIGEPFVNNDWSNSNSAVSSEWLVQKAPSPDRPTESNTLIKKSNNNSGETKYSDIQFEDISIDSSLETSKTLMAIDSSNTENIPLDFHHVDFSTKNIIENTEIQPELSEESNKEIVPEIELNENSENTFNSKDQEAEIFLDNKDIDTDEPELKIDEDVPYKDEFDADLKQKVVSAFGGLMAKALNNRLHAVVRKSKKIKGKRDFASAIQAPITDYAVPVKKNKPNLTDSDSNDCPKKLITKGAMKVFEGLKVSIPTQDLNLTEVLNCSNKPKNGEIIEKEIDQLKNGKINENIILQKCNEINIKPNNKNGKLKNLFGKFGNKLGLKETKKKNNKQRNKVKNHSDNKKSHDVYEFEESMDSNYMFKSGKFSLFRTKDQCSEKMENTADVQSTKEDEEEKIDDTKLNHESGIGSLKWNGNDSDSDTDRYYDSMSFEEMSLSSESTHGSDPNLNKTKPVKTKNTEKSKDNQKKCMIMGRIFKNASKPKLEDKIPEIRDISSEENSKLVENYLDSCSSVDNVENITHQELPPVPNNVTLVNNTANKMSKVEMDLLFDKLLEEEKKHTESTMTPPLQIIQKEESIKEFDVPLPPLLHSDKNCLEKKKMKEGKTKTPGKSKKRQRHNSGDSTSSEEFTLGGRHSKSSKKHHKTPRKSTKAKKDTGINLEQEMKECIGVAGRKSQRKCTSGKQNVLIEFWSSDESSFEEVIKMLGKESEPLTSIEEENKIEDIENSPTIEVEELVDLENNNSNSNHDIIPTAEIMETVPKNIDVYDFDSDIEPKQQDHLKIKIKLNEPMPKPETDFIGTTKIKIPKKTKRIGKNRKHSKSHGEESDDTEYEAEKNRRREHKRKKSMENGDAAESETNPECLAITRKKRNAGDQLYYWSSSSDDEFQDLIEVKPIREDTDDDRPMQHGWIVGDSPKKLVTMLAQAKGKKVEGESVKEQGKKNRVTL